MAAKKKTKTGKKRPVRKAAGKETVVSLEKKAGQLLEELSSARKKIVANETKIKNRVSERKKTESRIRALLRKNIASEKAMLSVIKASSSRKQFSLKKKIVSLKKINQVYSEKETRIKEAKKKQIALKKQLDLLECQVVA